MSYNLEAFIKASFAESMDSYIQSDTYKEGYWELNKVYSRLFNRLLPEEREMLDAVFNALQDSGEALAEEAYYRGIVLGMTESKKLLDQIK